MGFIGSVGDRGCCNAVPGPDTGRFAMGRDEVIGEFVTNSCDPRRIGSVCVVDVEIIRFLGS